MRQIVVADPSFDASVLQKSALGSGHEINVLPLPLEHQKLGDAFALFIRTRVKIGEELLSCAPKLKIVISATSGREHVDEQLCQRHGIKVAFTGTCLAPFIAEYVLLLMLQLGWNNLLAMDAIQKGKWKDHLPKGEGLRGKCLGIVGLGAIGAQLAEDARIFNMRTVAHSPSAPREVFSSYGITELSLEELLGQADFVVLALSYRKSNEQFFSHREFSLMRPSSCLINVSRGEMVCEDALLWAVEQKIIRAAALDVFSREPLPADSPLRNHDSIILTPHYATHNQQALNLLTKESFAKFQNLEAEYFSL